VRADPGQKFRDRCVGAHDLLYSAMKIVKRSECFVRATTNVAECTRSTVLADRRRLICCSVNNGHPK
jgi:hypothetical protein